MRSFTITIKNETGKEQNYILFNQSPDLTGPNMREVWAAGTPQATPNHANATFLVQARYVASDDSASEDARTARRVRNAITTTGTTKMGAAEPKSERPGVVTTTKSSALKLGSLETRENSAWKDVLRNDNDASTTKQGLRTVEVKSGTMLASIGLEQSQKDAKWNVGLVPASEKTYILREDSTFWVVAGKLTQGEQVDTATYTTPKMIDFSYAASTRMVIVHDDKGDWNAEYV